MISKPLGSSRYWTRLSELNYSHYLEVEFKDQNSSIVQSCK